MIREISQWLLHDDQNEFFEIVFAALLNILFLALIALLLWVLGPALLALRLAKGYGVLWTATLLTSALIGRMQRFFRVDLYDRANLYLASNLFASCTLQAGWAAFAAPAVRAAAADGARGWVIVALFGIGVFSCIVAFYVVSSFYQGHFYRFISLPLALLSFIVFSVWPASGRILYGWFFELF